MSVLDTFYILFKTDADDVTKGAKAARESVDGLEKSIGGADKTSLQLGKKFNALSTVALAAFGAVAAVIGAIASAKAITAPAVELGVLSEVLGESAAEITNWGRAVQNMGGNAKEFQGSMRSLSGSLNDALINGPNAATAALAKLGISARNSKGDMKTVLEILPDLAKNFEGLNRQSAIARGKSLGLDEGTILLLMEGEKAVGALVARQREMNRVTDEDIETLRRLGVGATELGNVIRDITLSALASMIETLGSLDETSATFFESMKTGVADASARWEFFADGVDLASAGIDLFGENFDRIFSLVSTNIQNVIDLFSGLDFGAFLDDIDAGYQELKNDIIPGLGEIFDGISLGDMGRALSPNLSGIIDQIGAMGSVPLTAVGAGGGASAGSKSSSVSIGELTIETQATDAAGIAASVSDEMKSQLSNAVEQNDDGIAA